MPVRDPSNPTQHERGGPRRSGRCKILRKAVVADEAAPTTELQGIRLTGAQYAQFGIVKPAGVVDYDVSFYRYLEVYNDDGDALVGEWVLVETLSNQTESIVNYVAVDGQALAVRIFGINLGLGVIGVGFTVTYLPINRPVQ